MILKVPENFNPEVVIALLLAGIGIIWLLTRSKYKLPPGPWGLPIFGYMPFVGPKPFETFYNLTKKYGSIFSVNLGGSKVIVLNDYNSIKEAFNHPDVLDRPEKVFDFVPDGLGFAGNNGTEWVEQRRYSMKLMRDIGLGKSSWDSLMEEEVADFIKFLEENAGKEVNILKPLAASISNNMTSLVFGKRLPEGDQRRDLVDSGIDAVTALTGQAGFAAIFPNLFQIMTSLGLTRFVEHKKKIVAMNSFLRNEMEKRKKHLTDENSEIYFDEYLKEMKKYKGDKNTSFNEKNLLGNAQSLIIGGSETTRNSLLWLMLAMAANPQVQKKVQEEIDIVLGKEGKCSWMERAKLPYTYASLMEVQRWRTIIPLSILHRANADVKLFGFDIPKGTPVMSNIWAVHNDSKNWKKPDEFIPERFLTKEGSLIMQKMENYIPFSIGRRNCPGEFIAMIEIFHYFIAIMQKFQIHTPVQGQKPNLDGDAGGTYQPKPQKLVFTVRD